MKLYESRGFTLMELLVVVVIISVLASIAIPQYQSYKKRAFDTLALSDLRSAALSEEAYFFDYQAYSSCQNQSCLQLPGLAKLSKGVELQITATTTGFKGASKHPKGSGKSYFWDSYQGGLQN